jgi:hypothetical protein
MEFASPSSPSAADTERITIPIDSRRIARILVVLAFALITVGVATSFVYDATDRPLDWWFHFVDVNGEGNLPAWFSVLLLGGVSLLLFATARIRRVKGLGAALEWSLLGWFVVAMSLDEMTSVHEFVGGKIDEQVHVPLIAGYAWIVPGAIIAAGAALVGWRALRSLPAHTRRALVIAAAVFVAGALVLEVAEALLTDESGTFGTAPKLVTGAQELLEMLGTIMIAMTMLREVRRLSAYIGVADPASLPEPSASSAAA